MPRPAKGRSYIWLPLINYCVYLASARSTDHRQSLNCWLSACEALRDITAERANGERMQFLRNQKAGKPLGHHEPR